MPFGQFERRPERDEEGDWWVYRLPPLLHFPIVTYGYFTHELERTPIFDQLISESPMLESNQQLNLPS